MWYNRSKLLFYNKRLDHGRNMAITCLHCIYDDVTIDISIRQMSQYNVHLSLT